MKFSRMHANDEFLKQKKSKVFINHVSTLNKFVEEIRKEHIGVPYFDPADGGKDARVLILLEAPGPKARDFVSCDNNDQTAENTFNALNSSGLTRQQICIWNIVPFYIGTNDRSRIRPSRQADIEQGLPWLRKLLQLLPKLEVVVLLGRRAGLAEKMLRAEWPSLRILIACHPSPRALNGHPERRLQLCEVFRQCAT